MNRAIIYLRVSTLEQTQTAGDDKGYSIHAQESACRKKAESLDLAVVDVYVERAESARSANRPQLQAMFSRIRNQQDVDALIVYKVDRFARNRIEDGAMLAELQVHGVQLISVTENVDDTPAGRLTHGILATIAEYEVANLGVRSAMGMEQKARMGGTPGKAPIGYSNVRETKPDGREIRTIAIDQQAAPLVQWAFRAYASGEYTLADLMSELDERGLRARPGRRGARPKPLSKSGVGRMLRDVYYTGKVRYKGDTFDGNHEPLVSQQLFDQVQDLLTARNTSGTRRRVHDHQLKGCLRCEHCQGRMYLAMTKNRHGQIYPYFFCQGRRDGHCQLPYVKVDEVTDQFEVQYTRLARRIADDKIERLRSYLTQELDLLNQENKEAIDRADARLERLATERRKLLDLFYDDIIERELFDTEQRRIDNEERQARNQLRAANTQLHDVVDTVTKALQLLQRLPETISRLASIDKQRSVIQLFYDTIYVSLDDELVQPELQDHTKALIHALDTVDQLDWQPGQPLPANVEPGPDCNEPEQQGSGSHMSLLVPRTGFEPVLPP